MLEATPRRPRLANDARRRKGEPGRTLGDDSAIQRDRLNPIYRLFGQVTSQARCTRLYDRPITALTNTEAPKGTELAGFSEEHLDAVAAELNDRPRKRLEFQTRIAVIGNVLMQ